jgi:hypothetical protein
MTPLVRRHPRPWKAAAVAVLALLAVATSAQPPAPAGEAAKVIRVGPRQKVQSIAEAARLARDGDTVEIEGGRYIGDVAVWTQNRLTIRGVNGRPKLIAGGASAEGKAIWVVRGSDVLVESVEFTGARVQHKNGAGIRHERGKLTVRNCVFLDNENGILTGHDPASVLEIENSEFGHNGAGDGYSHGLYVGSIARLGQRQLFSSRQGRASAQEPGTREHHRLQPHHRRIRRQGQLRAGVPNGGKALVIGNVIHQSSNTDNPAIVAFGRKAISGRRTRCTCRTTPWPTTA